MCVLHNFLCTLQDDSYLPRGYADVVGRDGAVREGFWRQEAVPPLNGLNTISRSVPGAAMEVRERMRDYFSGNGSVDWQLELINRR